MSDEPPATNGITTLIGLVGQACARAPPAPVRAAAVHRAATAFLTVRFTIPPRGSRLFEGEFTMPCHENTPPLADSSRALAARGVARACAELSQQADPRHRALRGGRHF